MGSGLWFFFAALVVVDVVFFGFCEGLDDLKSCRVLKFAPQFLLKQESCQVWVQGCVFFAALVVVDVMFFGFCEGLDDLKSCRVL